MDADSVLDSLFGGTSGTGSGTKGGGKSARKDQRATAAHGARPMDASPSDPSGTPGRDSQEGGHKRPRAEATGSRGGTGSEAHNEGLRDIVRLQGALLLQLSAENRQVAREEQFIVGMPLSSKYRELMVATQQRWNENIPEVGKHPMGALHQAQWMAFWQYSSKVLAPHRNEGNTAELIRAFVEDRGTSINRFHALGKRGRPPPTTGDWLWVLRFDALSQHGRELAELLRHNMASFDLEDCYIRMDRGTMGGIERQLRDMQLGTPASQPKPKRRSRHH